MLEDTLPFDEYTRSLCTRRNEFVERIRSKLFQIDLLPAGAKSKTKSWVHEIFVDMLIIEPTKRLTAEQLIEKHFVWKINRGIQDRQFLQISKQLLVGYLASSRRIEGGKVVCYYLALLLALHDYHRMDDKLKGVSNSDGKKRICLKVKLEINRFVVLLQHWQSKVMPAEQSKEEEENYCLSEAMTKMTESWKQELI